MISVAICEDDSITLDILEELVVDYGEKNHRKIRVSKFFSGNEMFSAMKKSDPFDVFILDYYMPFMNGVDVAKKLRQMEENGIIIFSTSSMDGVIDAFEVNAFRYLLKPINPEVLAQVLDQVSEKIDSGNAITYDVKTPDGLRKVRLEDIIFIEKANRSLRFHMFDGDEIDSSSIQGSVRNAVLPLIEKYGFMMAGSSLVINMKKIESMSRGDIFFCNGDEITPPRREYTDIKEAWNRKEFS